MLRPSALTAAFLLRPLFGVLAAVVSRAADALLRPAEARRDHRRADDCDRVRAAGGSGRRRDRRADQPLALVLTILLALFLALSKRRHELVLLADDATGHRPILEEYSPYLLDQMISVVTASTLVAYAFYTVSPETVRSSGRIVWG